MMTQRLPDWEARLHAHIERGLATPYRLGKHDCAWWASAGVEAITGINPWPHDAPGYTTPRGQVRALRRMGWASLDDACEALLGDAIPPLACHSGDVISDGSAIGMMTPSGPVVFGEDGMTLVQLASVTRAWAVGRADG